ncbi:Pentatricopeptide repeat [Dillenia turbinata]|uniref:Pentatricopeptide repeat n=1 Tax=Dillenia turbinata TaxID=194707 RepID=A0AAN8YZT0_9MAGN
MIKSTKFCRSSLFGYSFLHFSSAYTTSLPCTVKESVEALVEAKAYQQIPDILLSSKQSAKNPNPFSFLTKFPKKIRTQIVDEILQSFLSFRPRSCLQLTYSCLLSYAFENPDPLPLALAIIQRTLRSGCLPVSQTYLLLSSAWLHCRHQSKSVANILLEMHAIGYRPDCGTCNYLILSLCEIDQLNEAIKVLKGMTAAGCLPDLESYGTVIGALCKARKTTDAMEMMKEMVGKFGLMPREGTVKKVVAAMRANREIWRAVQLLEFLEMQCVNIGFESFELAVEGCLECKEFVLAGKVVIGMTGKGFIPYIKVRQKVVEGLANAGEWELACTVRQRLVDLKS